MATDGAAGGSSSPSKLGATQLLSPPVIEEPKLLNWRPPGSEIDQEDFKIMSFSSDPRQIEAALKKYRFMARTEVLHQKFVEAHGLMRVVGALKRFTWHPGVAMEAMYLLSRFAQDPDMHQDIVKEGVADVIFSVATTHAKLALKNDAEFKLLVSVATAVGNLTNSPHANVRKYAAKMGAERISALLREVIAKQRANITAEERREAESVGGRMQTNLEVLCGAEKWGSKSKRDQKYYLNKDVYMLTKRGEPFFRLPK